MSRLIKFRVWDKLSEQFYYADSPARQHFNLSLDGRFCNLQNGAGGDEAVVQQFTGLSDRKVKEIYEGDILFDPFHSGWWEIGWNASELGFEFKLIKYTGDTLTGRHIACPEVAREDFEIVGNIFETPDLLKL